MSNTIMGEELKALSVKKKLMMTAGVSNTHPRIISAMNTPITSYFDSQFKQILRDVSSGIRYVLQTQNQCSFAISGGDTTAFETIICNILEIGAVILVAVHGVCGERFAKISEAHGFKAYRIMAKLGTIIAIDAIESSIKKYTPKILVVCHGDYTSGTLQTLREIAPLCRKNNCLFMVDASASLCCAPLRMDQLQIDVIISDTQFGLGLPPGLTIISFNARVAELTQKKEAKYFAMNLNLIMKSWALSEEKKYEFHQMPPITLIYALRESLAMIIEESLDKVIERHMVCALWLENELKKLNLKFVVENEKSRLHNTLVIELPDSVKNADQVITFMNKYYDICISKGVSPIEKVWRVGIYADNARRQHMVLLAAVFGEALNQSKKHPSQTSLSPSIK